VVKGDINMTTKTKRISFNENESLVLWRALEYYKNNCDRIHNFLESDYYDACKLLSKVIYKSCSFAGSLDEGETAETIYKDMIGD